VCNAFSKGALRGARGNSGVILSQIFKGFCSGFEGLKEITVKSFIKALAQSRNKAKRRHNAYSYSCYGRRGNKTCKKIFRL
jgi:dihydroxyacetone kinase-like predicted kinase